MPMGIQPAGVLCFNTLPVNSAFVPLELEAALLTNLAASPSSALAYSGRAIVIGKEPLLEASHGTDHQRLVTLYGIPDKAYEVSQATSLDSPIAWIPGSTNSVPGTLSATFPLVGEAMHAPTLYLQASER